MFLIYSERVALGFRTELYVAAIRVGRSLLKQVGFRLELDGKTQNSHRG